MQKIIENGIEYYSYPNLRRSQLLQLSLLKRVIKICENNKLQYWIDSGTLLGAVRHKAFIPWDDDLDICLTKLDYDKLIPILYQETLKDNSIFLKYFKNDKIQSYVENFCSTEIVMKENNGMFTSCRIDIFPMKLVEDTDETKDKDREITDNAYFFMHGYYRYNKNKPSYNIKNIHHAKQVKLDFMNYFNNEFMKNNYDKSDYSDLLLSYSYGSILAKKVSNYYKYTDVFPLKKIKFEDIMVSVPNNFDVYLKSLYGDYMRLPKLNQRVPFNVGAQDVYPDDRIKKKKRYLKNAEAYNLVFYFLGRTLGKFKLLLFFIYKIGLLSTIKGLKVTNKLKSKLNKPVFRRVFIEEN